MHHTHTWSGASGRRADRRFVPDRVIGVAPVATMTVGGEGLGQHVPARVCDLDGYSLAHCIKHVRTVVAEAVGDVGPSERLVAEITT